ncbi:hypothetical protein BJY01DRAFT_252977 [Aspergillus pseudoustus]|uniref:Uncharacterized protein n=1 Tax=Aspergillus pseudoustus TaxID=1810923 RepID=A0ABR4J3N6_9EURO
MNFNTGRDMVVDYINTDPATEPRFWFLIDIRMGREVGSALLGPSPDNVFVAPRVEWVLDRILESLDWHCRNIALTSDSILNACRGLRFAKAREWGSKMDGGAWVIGCYGKHDVVVDLAMGGRRSKTDLPQDQAMEFLDVVQAEVKECRSKFTPI